MRVAAIDIGTNAVRLIVAEVEDRDGYRVLAEEREQTRLGRGLQMTGRIDDEAEQRTLDALGRMQKIAVDSGVEALRVIATAALREAENGTELAKAARKRLGLEIEIISPAREAELAIRSVRRNFPLGDGAAAIVDIGGGSMEVVFTRAGTIDEVHSMPLGAVHLTERYVSSDPISAADWRRLRTGIARELERHIGEPPFPTPDLVGSGGTFTAVASLAMHDRQGKKAGPVQGYSMTPGDLEHQLTRLRAVPLAARRDVPGLDPDRADIIVAGAAAVAHLCEWLDVRRIRINERGVRHGLLLEMIEGATR